MKKKKKKKRSLAKEQKPAGRLFSQFRMGFIQRCVKKILPFAGLQLDSHGLLWSPVDFAASNLIFDLGLHVGQDTEFYLKQGFRVVAVDANPMMIEKAQKKFSGEIEEGRLHLVGGAISETEGGNATFFVNNKLTEWSSLDSGIGGRVHGATEVTVKTVRLDELFRRFGAPYYLKIDIEGADLLAVSQIPKDQRPRYVSVENGERALLDSLVELGYTKFQYINQANIRGLELKKASREGRVDYHCFPFGASGLFGEDLPGKWLSVTEAYQYAEDLRLQKIELGASFEREVGWFDLHAARGSRLSWALGL